MTEKYRINGSVISDKMLLKALQKVLPLTDGDNNFTEAELKKILDAFPKGGPDGCVNGGDKSQLVWVEGTVSESEYTLLSNAFQKYFPNSTTKIGCDGYFSWPFKKLEMPDNIPENKVLEDKVPVTMNEIDSFLHKNFTSETAEPDKMISQILFSPAVEKLMFFPGNDYQYQGAIRKLREGFEVFKGRFKVDCESNNPFMCKATSAMELRPLIELPLENCKGITKVDLQYNGKPLTVYSATSGSSTYGRSRRSPYNKIIIGTNLFNWYYPTGSDGKVAIVTGFFWEEREIYPGVKGIGEITPAFVITDSATLKKLRELENRAEAPKIEIPE